MSQVAQVIDRLKRFRNKISDPVVFYRSVQSDWSQLARRIVEQVLIANPPPNIEPEEWHAKIVEISARVAVDLFNAEEIGLLFSITPRVGAENVDAATFAIGNISISDVQEWVRAGRDKASIDEPGKNLDERDLGKTDLQIAWRVMYALKLRKPGWERLSEVLREFVGIESEDLAEQMYGALLKAWMEHFIVRAPEDFRRYVSKLVRSI